MNAQRGPDDALGWLVDMMSIRSAGANLNHSACVRARNRLLYERAELAEAMRRENAATHTLLMLADDNRSALANAPEEYQSEVDAVILRENLLVAENEQLTVLLYRARDLADDEGAWGLAEDIDKAIGPRGAMK